ncbi:MAG: hypothetical protein ABI878_10380 [Acidobacteriota bacterium]
MKMKFRLEYLILVIIAVGALGTQGRAQSAGSPPIYEVKFVKGVYVRKGTVQPTHPCPENGPTECGNGNSMRFTLNADKGDRVRITLTSETGGAIFSIATPDDWHPLNDNSTTTTWTGTLGSSGAFPLTVYTFKSFTHFTLRVTKLN